ncbi:Cell division control protein 6 -like protein CDC6-related protein p62(cdc6) [Triplophysa tibetana]|uniref:Cell division control protein n=1 Tax=Triplophysa tibetana TaxID=1572043 RepID=A0A5A9NCX3_9TELE|nr:Cell division control protein 6 -like protein CDC6-related protein p62(cdc6) [Triplophysa tibetana]
MPSTRSQNQPTLQFPRRKSSRLGSRPKVPSVNTVDIHATPLSPIKTNVLDSRSIPLSPRSSVLKNTSLSERLPLSPRKRTGDENGCNLPTSLLGSPPKQSRPALCSPRKLSFNENKPVFSSPPRPVPSSPKIPLSPVSRPSPKRPQESACFRLLPQTEGKTPVARLFSTKNSGYQSVKQALHTAVPERLLSRETERAAIVSFLKNHVVEAKPSSLYISGAPGTGKTACLNCVLQEQKALLKGIQTVVINCMNLRSSHAIFPLLGEKLGISKGHSEARLAKCLTGSGPTVLLVLDEMDQLDSKSQEVLYTIFEWPYLPKSRLCLIGIANALDLTDRILPRLQAKPHCRPKLLNFPPYSHEELNAIVQDRIAQVSGEGLLDAAAVQFCARKVSSVSGDARKALDICRRAVEIVEASDRSKAASEPSTSPKAASRVSVPQVARVLSEVYGDRMASRGGEDGESFPLQQKLLVCCLLLVIRNGKSKDVQLGKLYEVYSKLCKQRQVGGAGQTECLSLCSLLESRGIFTLKKAKEARMTKISLRIEERDVENALKDRTLLGSILAAGLP